MNVTNEGFEYEKRGKGKLIRASRGLEVRVGIDLSCAIFRLLFTMEMW
jgi:hypothetical protein